MNKCDFSERLHLPRKERKQEMKLNPLYPLNSSIEVLNLPVSQAVLELLVSGFNNRMQIMRPPTQVSVASILNVAKKLSMKVVWDSGLFAEAQKQESLRGPFGIGEMLQMAFGRPAVTMYEFFVTSPSRIQADKIAHSSADHLRELLADELADVSKLPRGRGKKAKGLIEVNQASISHLREMLENLDSRIPELSVLMVPVEWNVSFLQGYMRFVPTLAGRYISQSAEDINFELLLMALNIHEFSLPIYGLVSCENHPKFKWVLNDEKLELMKGIAPAVARDAGEFITKPGDMFELLKYSGVNVDEIKNVGIAARMLTQLDGLNKK